MIWDKTTAYIIGMIYESVDPEQGWNPLMEVMTELFASSGGHFAAQFHADGGFGEHYLYGIDDSQIPIYEHFVGSDPRLKFGLENPLVIINDADLFDARSYESTPFFNEVLAPNNFRFSLTMNLQIAPEMNASFGFMRSRAMGSYGPEHVAALQMFVPHMIRALQMQHRLRGLERFADDVVSALDQLPTAALMVTGDLKIACLNRKAERLLAATPTLTVRGGRLTLERPTEASALKKAVSNAQILAGDIPNAVAPPPELVSVSRAKKLPLRLLAAPLRSRSRLLQHTGQDSRVLLLVYDPEARLSINRTLLESLYGLTSTEAFIAARLAEGRSIIEIAAERRCSEGTVRTHVKKVFRKTDTKRQGELVQLLLGSQALSSSR